MMKKARFIERDLNGLRRHTRSLALRDSIEVVSNLFAVWKRDLVEVPGNNTHNHESHSHKQTHYAFDVTPEQMLEIQKELDTRLSSIAKKLADIKPLTFKE